MKSMRIMYAIDTVELHIVQPRIDNISSWAVDVKELIDWADNEVRPKAQMAVWWQRWT